MKVLVSNIGSTSFKFRLFDMAGQEREIAVGGADRIGGKGGVLKLRICDAGVSPSSEESSIDKRPGRYLPHWNREGATYAVTFRLADSVPQHLAEGWRRERQEILDRATRQNRDLTYDERVELNHLFSTRIEAWLDAGHGECLLKNPRAAEIVQTALCHFDNQRYELLAWAVMPNHVHCVLRPLAGHDLPKIMQSWKSFTAKEINRILGRQGQLWLDEYYDHLIRDERDFNNQVNYVLGNPAKVGLKDWPWYGKRQSDEQRQERGQDVRETRGQDALVTRGQDVRDTRGRDARVTKVEVARDFADHGSAIVFVLEQLVAGGALAGPADLDAVAFKAVMAGDVDAVCHVDEKFLARMEYFVPIAPAHNPPYIAAMRMFQKVLGGTPLVAAMETGFHRTVPDRRRLYAVPTQWAKEYGVKRYGFHGASHRYIATRTEELMGEERRAKSETAKSETAKNETAKTPPSGLGGADRLGGATRIISCHLGGSSSLCAIRDGASVAVSMGLSPQSGLPQSNRAGEFDPFAFSLLARQAGLDTAGVLKALGSQSGLAALSETSGDIRDILEGIAKGCPKARLTLELFVTAVRDYIGAYLVELGGAEAIVFTGGIGQHNPEVRTGICKGLEFAGIKLDESKNAAADGNAETRIEAADSKTALWVMPTNEELIVARQTVELLKEANSQ